MTSQSNLLSNEPKGAAARADAGLEQNANAPAWQAVLDSRLTRRLLRPLKRPGMIGTRLARSAVARLQRMAGGFPLLPKLSERWSSPEVNAAGQVPIVYAQPALPSAETVAAASSASPTHSSPRPIVQAKAAPASPTSSSSTLSAKPLLSLNNPATTSSASASSLGDQSHPALVTNPISMPAPTSELTSVRPIKTDTTHLQPVESSPPPPPSTLHSPSLPVVRPRPASGNVVQRKSIANISTSVPSVISKQTDNTVQRKVASEPSPKLTAASASAESPAPLPVARPRTTSAPETPLGRELLGEPALNLASPAPVQRVVVRPLPTLSTESNLVQRTLHPPGVVAATPEVGRASASPSSAPALPFSTQANHAAPEFVNTTSGNQARPMPMISHTSSTPPVIQRQVAPVEQKTPTPVIQRASSRGGAGGGASDIDELAEKVQAKLAHWLTIESERRGLTRWD